MQKIERGSEPNWAKAATSQYCTNSSFERERQSLAYTECLLKPLKDTVRAQPGVQAGTMGRLHMLDFEDAICLWFGQTNPYTRSLLDT